jgi:hypothetical protein
VSLSCHFKGVQMLARRDGPSLSASCGGQQVMGTANSGVAARYGLRSTVQSDYGILGRRFAPFSFTLILNAVSIEYQWAAGGIPSCPRPRFSGPDLHEPICQSVALPADHSSLDWTGLSRWSYYGSIWSRAKLDWTGLYGTGRRTCKSRILIRRGSGCM